MDEQSAQHISKIIGEHMRFKKNGLKTKPSNKSIKKFVTSFGDTCVNGVANIIISLQKVKEQAIDYMQGLTINVEECNHKGFAIASYQGLALGFVKQVNYTLKNHLPKGLRVSINLIK